MSSWEIADTDAALESFAEEWDALAVASGRPYCTPLWMRAWWRAAAPDGARLSVVAVRHGEELVGVAPFFTQATRRESVARLLCAGTATRLDLLAAEGQTEPVAAAVAAALASLRPRIETVAFEGIAAGSPWPQLVAASWPGRLRPRVRTDLELTAPWLDLAGGFEHWLASLPRGERRELLRLRRRWAELGARIELSPPERLDDDLAHLERLHLARWAPKGGSTNIDAARRAMLREAGRALIRESRFRLWTIRVGDEVAGAELFVAAGSGSVAWGGGFDGRWQKLGPSIVLIAAAAEDAAARGERTLDLGEGEEPYKLRLGAAVEPVVWTRLYPRTRRYPLTRARAAPRELRYALRRRLTPEQRAWVKRVVGRNARD